MVYGTFTAQYSPNGLCRMLFNNRVNSSNRYTPLTTNERGPVCLTVDDALEWVDPDTPVDAGLELLSMPRPESAFRWWQVTRAMGNSRYQGEDAAEPV